jgi:hypothetical protein
MDPILGAREKLKQESSMKQAGSFASSVFMPELLEAEFHSVTLTSL